MEWLAGLVHAAGPGIAEAIKWRRLTFTVHGDWHHWLCAIAVSRPGVSLLLHKGSLLADPASLLEPAGRWRPVPAGTGEGRYLRRVRYERAAAHPEAMTELLRDAIARQTDLLP